MEFGLVGKMLNRDSRNFHGWGYRREVVAALEGLRGDVLEVTPGGLEHTMTQGELNYTTKMVGANLSNFSAWHSRSQLILKLLNERAASDEERRKTFEDGMFPQNEYQKVQSLICPTLRVEVDTSRPDRSLRPVYMVLPPRPDVRL